MFDLGYKQIVINSDAVVVETAGASGFPQTVAIEGFGTFTTTPADTVGNTTAPVAAALGVYSVSGAGTLTAGNAYNVKIYFKEAPRLLSELWPRGEGQIMVHQSAVLAADDTLGAAILAGGVIDGFNDKIIAFSDDGVNAFGIDFVAGYEGVGIEKVSITAVSDISGVEETFLTVTQDVAPSEGVGTGKQIEAEVHNSTFDNIDPYGVQFGGNTAVDVRGTYQTIYWERAVSISDWENHAMLGYGDANTSANYAPVKFIAFVNSQATAAIASINKLAADTANTI